MNIIQWLLENGHAKAQRHAENIIALLRLNELYDAQDFDGIKARVKLYETWKTSGLYDKKDRAACAMKAIAGEPVPAPVVDMFTEDEFCNCPAQHAYMTYIAHDETCPERCKVEALADGDRMTAAPKESL